MPKNKLKTIINFCSFFSEQEKVYWLNLIDFLREEELDNLAKIIASRTENIKKINSEKEKKNGAVNLKYWKILDNFKKRGINKYLKEFEKEDQDKEQKEADKLIN